MKLLCRLKIHKPIPSRLWNDEHFFTTCERCGVPLIRRSNSGWHEVPSNMKIVWRERTDEDIVWPTHII